jgi:hypothetical protein
MDVLRIEDGLIAETITFDSEVFDWFRLPRQLQAGRCGRRSSRATGAATTTGARPKRSSMRCRNSRLGDDNESWGDISRLGVRGRLSGRLRLAGAGNNIASRARLSLARLPRRSPHTRHPRSIDPQFAESESSAPPWSAIVIPRA